MLADASDYARQIANYPFQQCYQAPRQGVEKMNYLNSLASRFVANFEKIMVNATYGSFFCAPLVFYLFAISPLASGMRLVDVPSGLIVFLFISAMTSFLTFVVIYESIDFSQISVYLLRKDLFVMMKIGYEKSDELGLSRVRIFLMAFFFFIATTSITSGIGIMTSAIFIDKIERAMR